MKNQFSTFGDSYGKCVAIIEKENYYMRLETERLIIRDLERKDQKQLYKIVWQKNVVRFMKDWSENSPSPESFDGYVDWHQTQKDSIDVYERVC